MRSKNWLPLLAAVVMTTSAVVPTFADATTEPATHTTADPARPIDLDLSGSTSVRDYINYLQEATGLNIVLMNEKGADPQRIEIPPLRLKQMPAETAITMLADLPGARITVEPKDNAYFVVVHAPDRIVGPNGPVDESGRTIEPAATRVISLEQTFFATSPFDQRQFSDADRAKILADKVPQMLKLMEEALSIDGDSAAEHALIKLHQGTNTLIVRGTPDQLATIDQVLKAIAPPAPSDEAKVFAAKLQDAERQYDRERIQLMGELQNAKVQQSQYVNEIAALRADLHIADQKLRAVGGGTTNNDNKPATQP